MPLGQEAEQHMGASWTGGSGMLLVASAKVVFLLPAEMLRGLRGWMLEPQLSRLQAKEAENKAKQRKEAQRVLWHPTFQKKCSNMQAKNFS